jgi:hypothetical protein
LRAAWAGIAASTADSETLEHIWREKAARRDAARDVLLEEEVILRNKFDLMQGYVPGIVTV